MNDFHLPISESDVGRRLLFSVRTRCVLLRATLVFSLFALVLGASSFRCRLGENWRDMECLPTMLPSFGGTALLQFLSAFRLKRMSGFIDLVLLLSQLGWVMFFIIYWTGTAGATAKDGDSVRLLISAYSILILLFLQCIWRIGATISTKGQNLWMPFDIQLGTPLVQRRRPLYILAGVFVWRRLFRCESNALKLIRGCLAIILLAIFIVFTYTNVVSHPLSELGLGVRVKTFRMNLQEGDSMVQLDNAIPVWNLYVVVNWDYFQTPNLVGTDFKQAVQVLPLYHNQTGTICENVDGDVGTRDPFGGSLGRSVSFEVICPVSELGMSAGALFEYLSEWNENAPDLFVTVNFTSLGILPTNITSHSPLVKENRSKVVIMAVLSNLSTLDVLSNAQMATIFPNEHLIGGVDAHIRQRFTEANAATLGLSSTSKMRTFLEAEFVELRPNPSSTIPRDSNTGSLYLYRQPHPGSWTVVTDYREDSVLSGLSQVGGFWTFINGLFAFIFGSRLVMTLFGVKPLSPFGLIHSFSRVDLSDSYPRILSEGDLPDSQRGLVALMRDHMVDLDSVKRFDDVESRGERDIEMEEHMIPSELPAGAASSMDSLSSARLVSPYGHREMV